MASAFAAYWYFWVILLVPVAWVLFRLFRPRADIKWESLESNLQWGSAPDDAVGKIYEYVVAFSDSTALWYQSRRQPKRHWGVSLRVGALLATAAAGLVPLSRDILAVEIPGTWSTVLVAAAGVF